MQKRIGFWMWISHEIFWLFAIEKLRSSCMLADWLLSVLLRTWFKALWNFGSFSISQKVLWTWTTTLQRPSTSILFPILVHISSYTVNTLSDFPSLISKLKISMSFALSKRISILKSFLFTRSLYSMYFNRPSFSFTILMNLVSSLLSSISSTFNLFSIPSLSSMWIILLFSCELNMYFWISRISLSLVSGVSDKVLILPGVWMFVFELRV